MALSAKQQAFINEYLQCFNATEAALRAGYSEKSAHSIGWENLKKPEIEKAISQRLNESAMSADEVMMRLAEQARGVPSQYIGMDGTVMIAQLVRDGKTHLIKKIADTAQGRTYEFYDAQSALQMIGRHHALFTDRTVSSNIEIDLSKLTNEQLDRVANGEDPMKVILDGYIASTQSES